MIIENISSYRLYYCKMIDTLSYLKVPHHYDYLNQFGLQIASPTTRRRINAVLTLVQRRRLFTNVKPSMIQRLLFAGNYFDFATLCSCRLTSNAVQIEVTVTDCFKSKRLVLFVIVAL